MLRPAGNGKTWGFWSLTSPNSKVKSAAVTYNSESSRVPRDGNKSKSNQMESHLLRQEQENYLPIDPASREQSIRPKAW